MYILNQTPEPNPESKWRPAEIQPALVEDETWAIWGKQSANIYPTEVVTP